MKNLKKENGAITIITVVTILFIISFLLSSYIIVANKVKTQKEMLSETKKIYESTGTMEEAYNSYFDTGNVIPIYTVDQLLMIGKGQKNVNINGKYYNFNNNENTIYELMCDLSFNASDYKDKLTDSYWTPIGDNTSLVAKFEGRSHTIEVTYGTRNKWYSYENNYSDKLPEYNKANKYNDGTLAQNAKYTTGQDTAIIPRGFKVSQKADENIIENGLVIIDSSGNEFVWIPCSSTDYNKATFDSSWSSQSRLSSSDPQQSIGEESLKEIENNRTRLGLKENEGAGFYVARYEAGIPDNATFFGNSEGAKYYLSTQKNDTEKIKDLAPVSKKGYPVWNAIDQINAKTVSQNMYSNSRAVKSYLIDSHAWNYICKNIFEEKLNIKINGDCSAWGNYYNNTTTKYEELDVLYALHTKNASLTGASQYKKGVIPQNTAPKGTGSNRLELSAGASNDFKKYNIYDMAGNVWEWTTEESTVTPGGTPITFATPRGGCFDDSNTVVSADIQSRLQNFAELTHGFRVVLYL